jgi:hypothetical protein
MNYYKYGALKLLFSRLTTSFSFVAIAGVSGPLARVPRDADLTMFGGGEGEWTPPPPGPFFDGPGPSTAYQGYYYPPVVPFDYPQVGARKIIKRRRRQGVGGVPCAEVAAFDKSAAVTSEPSRREDNK